MSKKTVNKKSQLNTTNVNQKIYISQSQLIIKHLPGQKLAFPRYKDPKRRWTIRITKVHG